MGDERFRLEEIGRIVVVGAGKAGAGMAAAVEEALGPRLVDEKQLAGWVNVPADCIRPLRAIKLHPARPAGVNEPTPAGAAGARRSCGWSRRSGRDDLCLCLISGGGSALLPAPRGHHPGRQAGRHAAPQRRRGRHRATQHRAQAAQPDQRRRAGPGLPRRPAASTLIISDVLGRSAGPDRLRPHGRRLVHAGGGPGRCWKISPPAAGIPAAPSSISSSEQPCGPPAPRVPGDNLVIGNNAKAVDAAGAEGRAAGLFATPWSAPRSREGRPRTSAAIWPIWPCECGAGRGRIASSAAASRSCGSSSRRAAGWADATSSWCSPRWSALADGGATASPCSPAGTDGEDGPTDAAGAVLDAAVLAGRAPAGLDPADYLARNDAYHFFAPLDALVKTGPRTPTSATCGWSWLSGGRD